jgi:hypothetical protein
VKEGDRGDPFKTWLTSFWTPPTVEEQIEGAHFGGMYLSEPCEICGRITYAGARVRGRFVYLCSREHWNKDGLRQALEREAADV